MRFKTNKSSSLILVLPLVLIISGLAVYINSINGGFLLDDDSLIRKNVFIKSFTHIPALFLKSITAGSGREFFSWRPLQMLTYMLDYSLWKLDVRGYHFTNILLHIAVALTIYWLISLLFNDQFLAVFTSFLFVLHPIHTEAVAYISGRADSLSALFMILCLILYIKSIHSRNKLIYVLVIATYLLALLSKENTLILPLALVLYHYSLKEKLEVSRFIPILTMAALYILLRFTLLESLLPHTTVSTTVLQRIPGFFVAITDYIRLMILPLNLHMEYGNRLFSLTDPKAISGVIIIILLLTCAFKNRNKSPLVTFSIFWFLITLIPSSNIYPVNAYMAEHWLYIPSMGFFLILSNILCYTYRTDKLKAISIILIIAIPISYFYLTIKQNNYWLRPLTFYKQTLRYAPDSWRAYNGLGAVYYGMGRREESIALFEKAIAIKPDCVESLNNLGNAYAYMGKEQKAVDLYKKAIETNPVFLDAYNNLATIYKNAGRTEEAIDIYKKALVIDPNFVYTYCNLADAYKDIGRIDEAITFYKKAIEIYPDFACAYHKMGLLYDDIGKKEEAITSYKKAIELDPNQANPYNNLGMIYYELGSYAKAADLYKKAIELDPRHIYAYNNLGMVYYKTGRYKEAISCFRRALGLDPEYAVAYFNLAIVYYNEGKHGLAIENSDRASRLGYKANPEFLKMLEPYRKKGIK